MPASPIRKLRAVGETPEQRLRLAFAREDAALAELAQARADQREARRAYAEAHGLLCLPSMDTLRKVLR